jgi:DNA-binding transcriptional MerR regulator
VTDSLFTDTSSVAAVIPAMLDDETMAKAPTDNAPQPTDAEAPREYTIDELATLARVPSRTIRFYQSAGALPKPLIRGRVAYYGQAHVERLEQIAMLQDRGLQIKAIRSVVEQSEKGEFSIQEWLGFHDQLSSPWAGDRPKILTDAELHAMLKEHRPGLAAELVRADAIERRGDSWLVNSPALLDLALRLERVGVTVDTSRAAQALLRKHLGRLSQELTELFIERGDALGAQLDRAYEELRPVSIEAVRVVFAREMERSVRKANESGAAAALSRRRSKKK